MTTPLFPFDPLARMPSNLIVNEHHTVSVINGVDHNYFVPRNAPFFNESLVVVDTLLGAVLEENVDYYLAYPFGDGTEHVGQPISGAIVLVDPNRTGTYSIRYRTLGGPFVNEITRAVDDGIAALDDLLHPDWSTIVPETIPDAFPPTPHMLRLDEVEGYTHFIAKLDEIALSIRSMPRKIMTADIIDLEETYTLPLLEKMAMMAAAIDSLSSYRQLYYVESSTVDTQNDLTNVEPNVWYKVLEATVREAGTYSIAISGNPRAISEDGLSTIAVRYTVNGQPVSRSYMLNSILGLPADAKVSVEVASIEGTTEKIHVSGPVHGISLNLLKISGD